MFVAKLQPQFHKAMTEGPILSTRTVI
jgi:hypothetical protein